MKHLVVPSGTVLNGEAETTQVSGDYKQDVWKYPSPAFVGERDCSALGSHYHSFSVRLGDVSITSGNGT